MTIPVTSGLGSSVLAALDVGAAVLEGGPATGKREQAVLQQVYVGVSSDCHQYAPLAGILSQSVRQAGSLAKTYRAIVQPAVIQNCQVNCQESLLSSTAKLITTAGISF